MRYVTYANVRTLVAERRPTLPLLFTCGKIFKTAKFDLCQFNCSMTYQLIFVKRLWLWTE